MIVLFCDNGYSFKEVDYFYAEEYEAAKRKQMQVGLISFEEITKRHNVDKATSNLPIFDKETLGIYRGWMLKSTDYKSLYESLLEKNIRLINNPIEYKFCHYLPNSYEAIKNKTPLSVWLDITEGYEDKNLIDIVSVYKGKSIIVKDYVKSQKHYWEQACFIPNSDDSESLLKITKKFIELQDSDLNIGIVYREFIEFQPLINHSISGMPLTKEFRVFIKNKKIMNILKYWDEGEYNEELPNMEIFKDEIEQISSNFYTIDIAQTKTGDWLIVELGDGQVAGLPDNADRDKFYESLKIISSV